MSDALLRVEGLNAGYGEMAVLHDITLEIARGEIVALVGSNGAGKTTLLRALSRVIPSTGRITFAGHALDRLMPDQVFSVGVVQVPEGRQLFDQMTVEENLLMGAYRRVRPRQDSQRTRTGLWPLSQTERTTASVGRQSIRRRATDVRDSAGIDGCTGTTDG